MSEEQKLDEIEEVDEELEVIDDEILEDELEESGDNWNVKSAIEAKKEPWGSCPKCGKNIYDKKELHTWIEGDKKVRGCDECYKEHKKAVKKEKEYQQQRIEAEEAANKSKAIKRLIWGLVALVVITGVSLLLVTVHPVCIILGFFIGCFVCDIILNNNPVWDVVSEMSTWGIHFPGLIWEFSLDGLLWLIGMKILFAVLGFFVTILVCILAFIVGIVISPFVLPLALYRNIHNHEVEPR